MYACPWCGKGRFSFWQKQSLGPTRTLSCPDCKRPVSVCWNRAQLAAIPVLLISLVGLVGQWRHDERTDDSPTTERVEEGPSPHPSPSEQTDAADDQARGRGLARALSAAPDATVGTLGRGPAG